MVTVYGSDSSPWWNIHAETVPWLCMVVRVVDQTVRISMVIHRQWELCQAGSLVVALSRASMPAAGAGCCLMTANLYGLYGCQDVKEFAELAEVLTFTALHLEALLLHKLNVAYPVLVVVCLEDSTMLHVCPPLPRLNHNQPAHHSKSPPQYTSVNPWEDMTKLATPSHQQSNV